jgi:hypothetical protein
MSLIREMNVLPEVLNSICRNNGDLGPENSYTDWPMAESSDYGFTGARR